ncbi:AI-2E family transporter, partial [Cytophaga aurantiaca]|uniref:AI-2E family transporter n=1 Tax=Cytophaga aurantiaca TaxID=29530 RepID=UPI0003822FD2
MESPESSFVHRSIETSIRLILFFGMIVFCYIIMMPFLSILLGGIILAVAAAPILNFLQRKFNVTEKMGAILITVAALIIFILPSYLLIQSLVKEFTGFLAHSDTAFHNHIYIEKLKDLPLINNSLYDFMKDITDDTSVIFKEHASQIETIGITLLGFIGSLGVGLIHFLASMIIAGLLLAHATAAAKFIDKLFIRIAGEHGEEFSHIAERTIQNVTKGIVGVAFIESVLAAFGFFMAGVPLAGVWTIICLLLSIVQVGIVPLALPIVIYMFYTSDVVTASLLGVWLALIYLMEHLLKPVLLGKGAPVPMPVIFIGVLGGFVAAGFIGMFLGAVLFSIAYKLFLVWLEN